MGEGAPNSGTGDLGRVLASGLLPAAAARIEARLAAEPGHAALWRRLGDLRRQSGEPALAAEAYARAAALDPRDAAAARALALLRGDPIPPPPSPWPVRHLRIERFLPDARLAELLRFASARRLEFAPTPVLAKGENDLRPDFRVSSSCSALDAVREWLAPLILEHAPEFARRLGEAPFAAAVRDFKMTRYGDGGFFGRHTDAGAGAEDRVLGFVFYFWFPPKRFQGGELAIYDWDLVTDRLASTCTTLPPEQNQLVVLPSNCWHEVLPVRCAAGDWETGRFTLNGWLYREAREA